MLELSAAQELILAEAAPQAASLPLSEALGLVLAKNILSPQNAPLFDNSAMDGFALCGEVQRYEIVGEVAAGQVWEHPLKSGQAIKIMTGAPVPESCDSVIPIEETDVKGTQLFLTAAVHPGQHIRRVGEEYQQGQELLPAGSVINPASTGLLAAIGQAQVPAYRKPKVSIIATGSELLPIDAPLSPGKLRDSNSIALQACVQEAGAEALMHGILPDERAEIRQGLSQALENCDILLTSGGVSVGDYDYVQELLLELGLQKKFWKVAIKPGKPVLFGTLNGKLVFGIPGNPASALVVFEVLIRPAIRKMLGHTHIERPLIQGRLQAGVKAAKGRLHFMRVHFQNGQIEPFQGQGSSNLLSISQANALLPVYDDYQAGQNVMVWNLRA